MKKIIVMLVFLLSACAPTVVKQPDPFIIGPVVESPMGCEEMRKTTAKADC